MPPDPTLQGFRRQFAEIMESEDLKPLERVVVLVDDLDRSLPDTVVETLEAIKLFLSVKKMAFVIAADEENVASAIEAARDNGAAHHLAAVPGEDRPGAGADPGAGQGSTEEYLRC